MPPSTYTYTNYTDESAYGVRREVARRIQTEIGYTQRKAYQYRAPSPTLSSTGTASRQRHEASLRKEDVPQEVLSVNVEISTTGEHVGLFVVTCAIEDAAKCTGAQPETADLPSGSARRYSFCYPHQPGIPRVIGLSGDMLDLASQTPLGSEHSWRIRTKGSRRNFRYEIEVDCAAGHAELIVDDEKKHLVLPWVSLEEKDCESTSRKAEGHTEKTQRSSVEEKDFRQPLALKAEETGNPTYTLPMADSDISILHFSPSPTFGHLQRQATGATETTQSMRIVTTSTVMTELLSTRAHSMPASWSTTMCLPITSSLRTSPSPANISLSPSTKWSFDDRLLHQTVPPPSMRPSLPAAVMPMQKTLAGQTAGKVFVSPSQPTQRVLYKGQATSYEHNVGFEPSSSTEWYVNKGDRAGDKSAKWSNKFQPAISMPNESLAKHVLGQNFSIDSLVTQIGWKEFSEIEDNSPFSCHTKPSLGLRPSDKMSPLMSENHQASTVTLSPHIAPDNQSSGDEMNNPKDALTLRYR